MATETVVHAAKPAFDGKAEELAALAEEMVNAAEARARKETARRIASILSEARRDAQTDSDAGRLRTIMHDQNDELLTIEALLSGLERLCADDGDQVRMLRVIGNKVEGIISVFADHI